MLLIANLADTKWCRKPEKSSNPWQMGTHLKVLSESYPMSTHMTGFRWFSKIFAFLETGFHQMYSARASFQLHIILHRAYPDKRGLTVSVLTFEQKHLLENKKQMNSKMNQIDNSSFQMLAYFTNYIHKSPVQTILSWGTCKYIRVKPFMHVAAKTAWLFWWYLSIKSYFQKIFEGEMFFRTLSTTLLQIFCKFVPNF